MEYWLRASSPHSSAVRYRTHPLPTAEDKGGGDSSHPAYVMGLKFVLLVFTLLITFGSRAEAASAKSVNFASNTPTLSGTLPLVVAQEFGFFAAEGLEVKTVLIRGGPTAMAALVGGGVDYTLVAGVAAVRAIAQNAPMLIVSGIQPYMDYTLLGAKASPASTILKAKSSASRVQGEWRNSPRSKAWPKRDWCATAITR